MRDDHVTTPDEVFTPSRVRRLVQLLDRWALPLLVTWGLLSAIVAGVVIRLIVYFSQPPLWTDEVMLQISILQRDYLRLLQPLDHGQMAPIGFLWLQKLSTVLFGWNELSVRLFPLLSGIGTILLVGIAVTQIASFRSALCGAALAGTSPFLITQSNQAKQYSVEAAMTAALVALCVGFVWKRCSFRSIMALFAASVLAILFSVPAPFIVACAWASTALVCRTRNARIRGAIFAAAAGTAAVFGIIYFTVYLRAGNASFMQRFWAPAYPDSQHSLADAVSLILLALIRPVFAFDDYVSVITAAAALLLLGFGLFRIILDRNWPLLVLLAGPFALAVIASLLRSWPLGTRLMVFSAPLAIALISYGIEGLLNLRGRRCGWVLTAFLAAMLLPPFRYSVYQARHPASTDNRQMIREVVQRAANGVVYIYAGAAPEWLFYSEDLSRPDWNRIHRWQAASRRLGDNPGNLYSRNRRVVKEGWDLVFPVQSRIDLLGTSSGSYSDAAGYRNTLPDPGWADNEADRIKATGAHRVFVFIAQNRQPVTDQLFASLRHRGMQLVESHEGITRWYLFASGGN
jgi:4-amino-4-deoxy-L-arabinose transferase-like glycosyltransferase